MDMIWQMSLEDAEAFRNTRDGDNNTPVIPFRIQFKCYDDKWHWDTSDLAGKRMQQETLRIVVAGNEYKVWPNGFWRVVCQPVEKQIGFEDGTLRMQALNRQTQDYKSCCRHHQKWDRPTCWMHPCSLIVFGLCILLAFCILMWQASMEGMKIFRHCNEDCQQFTWFGLFTMCSSAGKWSLLILGNDEPENGISQELKNKHMLVLSSAIWQWTKERKVEVNQVKTASQMGYTKWTTWQAAYIGTLRKKMLKTI